MFQNQRWHELESQRAYSTTESQAGLNRTSHLSVSELLFLKILAHHSSNFIVGKEVGGRLQLKKKIIKKKENQREGLLVPECLWLPFLMCDSLLAGKGMSFHYE